MAIETRLRWLIFGVEPKIPAREREHIMMHDASETNDMTCQYFSTEDFGVKEIRESADEKESEGNCQRYNEEN